MTLPIKIPTYVTAIAEATGISNAHEGIIYLYEFPDYYLITESVMDAGFLKFKFKKGQRI